LCRFLHAKHFQSKEPTPKYDLVAFSPTFHLESIKHGKINAVQMLTYNFQSIWHGDAKSWEDAGPLKVKYPINAENFKCN